MNIVQLINRWGSVTPERIAFHAKEQPLSYGQLRSRSDALAHWITTQFPQDYAPIVVYGHMQPEMLVCFLACVKAGHAYIPLDESLPLERVMRIVADSGAKLALSPTDLRDRLLVSTLAGDCAATRAKDGARGAPDNAPGYASISTNGTPAPTADGATASLIDPVPDYATGQATSAAIEPTSEYAVLPGVTVLDYSIRSALKLDEVIRAHDGKRPDPADCVSGEDNFYIIYTSGSTGAPKGVQVTHDCLASFIAWATREFALEKGQVFLNQAPFSFDLSVMDLYPALLSGSTLWPVDKEMIARPRDLFAALAKSGINVWTSTPSFAEMCLLDQSFQQQLLPSLHTFLFCGEVLANDCAEKLLERFPDAQVFNTYGPTEATVAITAVRVDEDLVQRHRPLPVGYCKPDCHLLIVDEDGHPVASEEKGEIVIVGPSVSKGYFNDLQRTAASFLTVDGMRAYRTGDTGYLQEGLLFYGGRKDFQVKLHGYRIELEDIEHHLRALPLVKAAAVLPVYNEKNGKCDFLTAVVVPEYNPSGSAFKLAAAIKKQLAAYVPAYMVPRKIVFKDSLPMTANGKLDRKQLVGGI
ncbi:D-alanine--poly(phosphoribitol) ligase subunit DltA [Numidum massiliense]|uniref:D-alanine--poly(phosphoribitol) ligase subunit DltA n=1 Tax=Numidum massiliense TaxID=1522315 RepID=UPI0006D556AE|nr:D-alanine--poly(phosphoribitol) ligase subunit DltA [Numidum massiliense]